MRKQWYRLERPIDKIKKRGYNMRMKEKIIQLQVKTNFTNKEIKDAAKTLEFPEIEGKSIIIVQCAVNDVTQKDKK